MALSKWFLCGAEGFFEKNEDIAFTFADKAARKSLPTAEFALAYYHEVGVGVGKDIERAKKWYQKVSIMNSGHSHLLKERRVGPSAEICSLHLGFHLP